MHLQHLSAVVAIIIGCAPGDVGVLGAGYFGEGRYLVHRSRKPPPPPPQSGMDDAPNPYEFTHHLDRLIAASGRSNAHEELQLPEGFFRRYVEHFYARARASPPVEQLVLFDNYHLQKHTLGGPVNPLAAENPALFAALEKRSMMVNFHSPDSNHTGLDPLSRLHETESLLRRNSPVDYELEVHTGVVKMTLEEALGRPRNYQTHPRTRHAVGGYLYGRMGRMGLLTHMHTFEAKRPKFEGRKLQEQPVDVDQGNPDTDYEGTEPGGNIIGILPGSKWGTQEDKPVVVGAHWDTVPHTPGYDDNGSGVAALLEVAATLVNAECHRNEHSVIFVLFDMEEPGCHGSLEFIRTFLAPKFLDRGIEIQGMFNLDTMLNFNDDSGSQTVPDNWDSLMPEAAENVRRHRNRGDFLGVITRGDPREVALADVYERHYRLLAPQRYRLERLAATALPHRRMATVTELYNHTFFWRSDNARFWYYNDDRGFHSYPAVMLTDTGILRGYMRECYHAPCDFPLNPQVKPDSLYFLSKAAQALVLSLVELTGGRKESS